MRAAGRRGAALGVNDACWSLWDMAHADLNHGGGGEGGRGRGGGLLVISLV